MAGTLTALFRLAGAGIVLAREGAVSVIDLDPIPPHRRARRFGSRGSSSGATSTSPIAPNA